MVRRITTKSASRQHQRGSNDDADIGDSDFGRTVKRYKEPKNGITAVLTLLEAYDIHIEYRLALRNRKFSAKQLNDYLDRELRRHVRDSLCPRLFALVYAICPHNLIGILLLPLMQLDSGHILDASAGQITALLALLTMDQWTEGQLLTNFDPHRDREADPRDNYKTVQSLIYIVRHLISSLVAVFVGNIKEAAKNDHYDLHPNINNSFVRYNLTKDGEFGFALVASDGKEIRVASPDLKDRHYDTLRCTYENGMPTMVIRNDMKVQVFNIHLYPNVYIDYQLHHDFWGRFSMNAWDKFMGVDAGTYPSVKLENRFTASRGFCYDIIAFQDKWCDYPPEGNTKTPAPIKHFDLWDQAYYDVRLCGSHLLHGPNNFWEGRNHPSNICQFTSEAIRTTQEHDASLARSYSQANLDEEASLNVQSKSNKEEV